MIIIILNLKLYSFKNLQNFRYKIIDLIYWNFNLFQNNLINIPFHRINYVQIISYPIIMMDEYYLYSYFKIGYINLIKMSCYFKIFSFLMRMTQIFNYFLHFLYFFMIYYYQRKVQNFLTSIIFYIHYLFYFV